VTRLPLPASSGSINVFLEIPTESFQSIISSLATLAGKAAHMRAEKTMETETESKNSATGQFSTASCWSCGEMRAAHYCKACGRVQPPSPVDYFALFGFPRKLNINLAFLEREFYQLSRKLHPDLNAQADRREQEWSLEQSSQLNDAYRTLKDPIKRTEYLLRLAGVELEEQSKNATEQARAAGELKKQVVPPDLLEEVFELNMQLEELRMNKKVGENDRSLAKELEAHKGELETKFEALSQELKLYWDEWDRVDGGNANEELRRRVRNKMVDLLNRRSYIRNLVTDVNQALES
jgi:molecular chaperone HscB